MRTVGIFTHDRYLGRLLCLLLTEGGFVPLWPTETAEVTSADLRIIDADGYPTLAPREEDVVLFRDTATSLYNAHARHLAIPFLHGALLDLLKDTPDRKTPPSAALPPLHLQGRTAVLRGERISLTETEATLLGTLLAARGDFVSRERLLRQLGDGKRSQSALNVYVHYVRKKLEAHGERVLLCSRAEGYAIDARFFAENGEKR